MQRIRPLMASAILLVTISFPAAYAAKTIYRCEKDGQITLTVPGGR